ncbi:LysR family transcriptional regulator [Streptomyces sp. NBC_01275]|uniref:LysR family transcriptional regulator n=1 Tax=Streptomyces sp. NBC_01275 TaxID=2903807 RepID=UPI00225B2DA8|nr:LysR family transcriptional regulator [Streptomyces sp. NBC_01275]MCX4765198.1 LysR family transcriptional regulator [Streptomyces sp. NBC_01275]
MSDLEVRQLRYFVAVAEELHFGRAAQRLGMAQPPLSRAIRELERQLGVTLLERTTRRVALTSAGEILLRDARTALDAVTAAARRARHAGQSRPALRLALKADYDGGLLPRILAAYRDEAAALPVELLLGGREEQVPALRDGRADLALLPRPFDVRGLDVEPLLTEPRLLAVAATDPLAAHSRLRLADLAGRVLPDGRPADRECLPPLAPTDSRDDDRPPSAHLSATASPHRFRDQTQIFSLVELGSILWFPPASIARRHPRPGVAYRTVSDLPPLELALAWPQESRSPAVAAFVRTALAIAGSVYPMDRRDRADRTAEASA